MMLAAGDTFRAAAIDQIKVWGERNGVPVIAQQPGADSAAVVFDALQAATARSTNVLNRGHCGAPAHQDGAHGRAHEGPPGARPDRPRRAPRDPARARRDHRPERARPGAAVHRGGPGERARGHQARRHRAGRGCSSRSPGSSPSPSGTSGWGKGSTTSGISSRRTSWMRSSPAPRARDRRTRRGTAHVHSVALRVRFPHLASRLPAPRGAGCAGGRMGAAVLAGLARPPGHARRAGAGGHPGAGARRVTSRGVAFRMDDDAGVFKRLDHREKNGYGLTPVALRFRDGRSTEGCVYIAPRENHAFLGPAPLEAMVAQITRCAGPSGTNRDYFAPPCGGASRTRHRRPPRLRARAERAGRGAGETVAGRTGRRCHHRNAAIVILASEGRDPERGERIAGVAGGRLPAAAPARGPSGANMRISVCNGP